MASAGSSGITITANTIGGDRKMHGVNRNAVRSNTVDAFERIRERAE